MQLLFYAVLETAWLFVKNGFGDRPHECLLSILWSSLFSDEVLTSLKNKSSEATSICLTPLGNA